MRILIVLILTVLSLSLKDVYSQQLTNIPSNSEGFIETVSNLLVKNAEEKRQKKEFVEQLTILWNSGTISDDEKERIYITTDAIVKKRGMVYPHLDDYIYSIYNFFQTNHDKKSYYSWDKAIHYMMNNKKMTLRNIQLYLDMTANLFKTNSIYKSSTTEWRASNNDFKFIYDNTIKLIFGEMDLTCYAKRDSVKILKTKGVYFPLDDNNWQGYNGKVTWERAGYEPNEVYAQLGFYKIKMSQSKYDADSVMFVNTNYFDKPILGAFEEKTTEISNEESATYPRFVSYTKRFLIKNIYENVDFDGGFSMQGAKFLGSGSKDEPARLFFYRNGEIFLTAKSKLYTFRKDRIIGTNTSITFVIDQDSIYHLGLTFKYFVDRREVELIRDGEGMSRSPFFNTFHKLNLDVEYLTWKIDDPKIDFKMMKMSSNNKAVLESENYYSNYRYEKLQGYDAINPLGALKKYINQYGNEKFFASDLANYLKKDVSQVRNVLLNLTFLGLITYDFDDDLVTVNKRFYDYISSHAGKIDYDVISFFSVSKEHNASLNLLNNEMKIFGVPQIQLSDSQNVVIYPQDEEIIVKKNRDFEFAGKIRAGLFIFSGKEFYFDYNNFKINLNNVDSLRLMVETGEVDIYGNKSIRNIKTLIENITGDLLIDKPFNKSGVKSFPEYPIFNSNKDSYVFYDKKSILGGAYSRDNFYFQIYPYTLDSLDNFRKEGLEFKGYFVSGGIFPPFEEKLTVQNDYSLGFIRKTPPEGFPLYAGKATFHNDIKLSHNGLRGDGDFKYITSTTKSNDFIFFPDSMTTQAQKMSIKKQVTGVEFPTVDALNVYVHYHPKEDVLYSVKKEIPQIMFDGQAQMNGTLKLQPIGLSGFGMLEFNKAELYSDGLKFKEHIVDADTAKFNLKALDMTGFAFKTDNVNAHVNFNDRKGDFKSNGEGSYVEFPQNQYICFMDKFTWYMDDEEIEVSASGQALKTLDTGKELSPTEMEDIQLEGSAFTSIHPEQDSLSFVAPSAKFNMHKNIITANEVKYIRIADATVYLGDGEVVIEKKAKMRTLVNSKIIANNTSRYHTIYNATTNVFGKKSYSSSGDYDYIDENNRKQIVHFDIIAVDSTIQSFAKGKINMTENFTLSPNYIYTGEVNMFANKQYLTFTGATKIAHECEKIGNYWLNFSTEINPNQIYIPVSSTPLDINNGTLINGIILKVDTPSIYSAFLTKPINYSDFNVLAVEGFLFFDKAAKQYKISNKDKLVEINLPGNYLSLSKDYCNIYGEGKLDFGADLGQVKLKPIGNINHDVTKDDIFMDIVASIDFFFSESALKIFTESLNKDVTLEAVSFTRKSFEKSILEILGKEESEKLKTEIYTYGTYKKLPKEFEHTMFFTDLKMRWDKKQKAYISEGKIGIGNILKTPVNKMVDGTIMIKKKRSGDSYYMYFEIDKANWFYFQYKNKQMNVASSNQEFLNIIKELKLDKRKMEVEKGQSTYMFYIINEKSKNDFLKLVNDGETNDEAEEVEEDGRNNKKVEDDN